MPLTREQQRTVRYLELHTKVEDATLHLVRETGRAGRLHKLNPNDPFIAAIEQKARTLYAAQLAAANALGYGSAEVRKNYREVIRAATLLKQSKLFECLPPEMAAALPRGLTEREKKELVGAGYSDEAIRGLEAILRDVERS